MQTKTFDHIPPLLQKVADMGYAIFTKRDYDLNLIGVRSPSREAGVFDDLFHVIYKDKDRYIQETFACTTDAGVYWLHNPSRVEGTAILKAGQYRGVWSLGLHGGRYTGLIQKHGKVTVWRDKDRDSELDMDAGTEMTGYFGINIHRAHNVRIMQKVDRWSAGCTVIQHPADYARLIKLCEMQVDKNARYGEGYKRFTYTLLED